MEGLFSLLLSSCLYILVTADCDSTKCTYSNNDSFTCVNKGCTTIPYIPHPEKVKVIHLRYNNITDIDNNIETPSLIHLDLSHNNITFIKSLAFVRCKHLQSLDLSSNNIQTIETSTFSGLSELRWLNLSVNHIQYLESDLFAKSIFLHLIYLDLSHNRIRNMEHTAFNDLFNLTTLRLSHNNLSENNSVNQNHFVGLKSLIHLYVDHNYLTVIKAGLFQHLEALNVLELSQNSITDIHTEAFVGLRNVLEIHLEWNLLRKLKPNTFNLKSLRTLNLNHNYMEEIVAEYLLNCSATSIHLQFMNILKTVNEGAFSYMPRIEKVFLSDNKILSSIHPEAFKDKANCSIREVDLSNNSLQSLDEGLLDWELVQVDLSLNPWRCDDKIKWMVNYRIKWKHRQETRCASPDHLKGRSIYELSSDDFTYRDPRHSPTNIVIGLLICSSFFVAASVITVMWKYRDRIMSQARTTRYKFLYSGGEDVEDDHVTFNVTEERRLVTSSTVSQVI